MAADVNKKLLIECTTLLTLLTETLLLDPSHMRQEEDERIKAIIQQDAAECLLQIALFEPGRALLSNNASVVDVLHMLVDKAWAEEAKLSAHNALLALGAIERTHEPEPDQEGSSDAGWLMMSYQW